MNQKEALKILLVLSEKRGLLKKEKQAVLTAIGILSWTSLAESRMKNLKQKKDKTLLDNKKKYV